MGFNEYMRELAARYRGNALPWAELNQSGKGLMQSDAYLHMLASRWAEFQAAMAQYNLKLEPSAIEAGLASLGRSLNEHARVFLDADIMGLARVASSDAFQIPGPVLRALLSVTYSQVDRAYFAHLTETWRRGVSASAFTVKDAEMDADDTYRLMGAVLMLHQTGLLAAAREQTAPAGLGAPPAAGVAAVVLQVGFMIAVCFVFYIVWESWERYQFFEACCLDAAGRPTDPKSSWCVDFCKGIAARGQPGADPFGRFMGDLGEGVKWGVAAAGVLLALAIGWPLLKRTSRARSAAMLVRRTA